MLSSHRAHLVLRLVLSRAVFPDLASRVMEVDVAYINRCVGVELGAPAIADLLSRMALTAKTARDGQAVSVEVPPTRSDVLHACDVMEVRFHSFQ